MMKKMIYGVMAAAVMSGCTEKEIAYEAEIAQYLDNKECAISFTYDDGMLCHYTEVAPELEKRGFRGTFWIIGANMGQEAPDYPWMNWDQVREMSERGHEMSNHTWNHKHMSQLSLDEVEKEIADCDAKLEAVTGKRPKTLAYPYNEMTDDVVALAEKNRVGTRLTQVGHGWVASHTTPDSMTCWLKGLLETREWGVTMTHGTTYGWDLWEHPEWLWAFYDEVKAEENRVWVGTFGEVSAYVREREQSTVQATGTNKRLTIEVACPLDATLYDQPLTIIVRGGDWNGKNPHGTQQGESVRICNCGDYLLVTMKPGTVTIEND